jgi:hypothetical protein
MCSSRLSYAALGLRHRNPPSLTQVTPQLRRTIAAMNKHLAQRNKTRTRREATKKPYARLAAVWQQGGDINNRRLMD